MDLLFAACREDQSGAAQGLKRGNRLLNLGVNVMMCPEFLGGRGVKPEAGIHARPRSKLKAKGGSIRNQELQGPLRNGILSA